MIENKPHRKIKSTVPKKTGSTKVTVRKQINYTVLNTSNTKDTQNRLKNL